MDLFQQDFRVEVGKNIGQAEISLIAKSRKFQARITEHVGIRPATVKETILKSGISGNLPCRFLPKFFQLKISEPYREN